MTVRCKYIRTKLSTISRHFLKTNRGQTMEQSLLQSCPGVTHPILDTRIFIRPSVRPSARNAQGTPPEI